MCNMCVTELLMEICDHDVDDFNYERQRTVVERQDKSQNL